MIVFASYKNESSSQEITLNIGSSEIKPSLVARNLGAMLIVKWTWNNTYILSVGRVIVKFDRLDIFENF